MSVRTEVIEEDEKKIQKISIPITDFDKDKTLTFEIDNSQGTITIYLDEECVGQCFVFGDFQEFLEKTINFLKEA